LIVSNSKALLIIQKPHLTLALNCLNTLIKQGIEFLEAVDKTSEALAVDRTELVSAYDSQG